jgi:catechol 2,3-dioxygenase-like lactoylglutathione lyase family enzyme
MNEAKTAPAAKSDDTSPSPLGPHALVGFAATTDPARAKAFYRDMLGLRLVSEDPFALVFDVHGTMLRVSRVREVAVAEYTVLGFEVADIVAAAKALTAAGVALMRVPGLPQDELGIWNTPDGTKVAWFKDPDGNTLSISKH